MEKKKIYYWSPFTSKVATISAVLNSAHSLEKYSNNKYDIKIINAFGEWDEYIDKINKNNLKLINLFSKNLIKKKDTNGYFKSRIYFIYIFFFCFFPLKNLLKKNKPNFVLIHLLTSLPLFLNILFAFKSKFILRISGLPKMNFFRKLFWKITLKYIYKITCPTYETKKDLINLKVCDPSKIYVLNDPIFKIRNLPNKKSEIIDQKNDEEYFISVGRLTKQKNYLFLINCFNELIKNNNKYKLIIVGIGEQKEKLLKKIKDLNLDKNIKLIGYKKNIFPYLSKSKCFILPSLWEDPGFVIVEAIISNLNVISSNCKNGPSEILSYGKGGYLFETNSKEDFIKKFYEFENESEEERFKKKIISKKNIKNFSIFSHYKNLENLLKN